jgi:hypothetical protein
MLCLCIGFLFQLRRSSHDHLEHADSNHPFGCLIKICALPGLFMAGPILCIGFSKSNFRSALVQSSIPGPGTQ